MRMDKSDSKSQLKYSGKIMRHWYWSVLMSLFLIILTAAVLYVDTLAGCMVGIFSLILYLTLTFLWLYYRPKVLQELIDFAYSYGNVQQQMMEELAIPFAIVQTDGKMLWMNYRLQEITGKSENYHKSITNLFPHLDVTKYPDVIERTEEVEFHDKRYNVSLRRISLDELVDANSGIERLYEKEGGCEVIALHFFDITELTYFKKENYEQKSVVGLLYMDNYEEAMESVEEVRRSMLDALVDRRITKYVSSFGGLIKKMEKDKYLLVVNRKILDVMQEDRFSVLEDVKTVNIGNSIGVTVSIGIGTSCGDYAQNYEAARSAIEMALARGGDQAVVRDQDKIAFYGGKTQRAEKNTRVRARVKAQALRELITARDRVIVMGHKITDVDSLGACVGVCRAALQAGKPAHIVLGDINGGIRLWVDKLRESSDYEDNLLITHEQAIDLTNQKTVVVVVDTNRPSMTECEELLYLTKTIVVIDHHRQSTDKIENAALSYVEPSASSACEMIAELLQYYDSSIRLKPLEADCMYAGIIIDTNNFVAKTGMRTFEAAAFLRRYGADTTRVRKAFRNDMDTYKARAEAVRHAELFMDSYAISICPAKGLESPNVVGAQAANELLNIIGVKASFVLTDFENKIFISARAIDEVNVQIIMERLGGGGHMNIAGAQLTNIDAEAAKIRLKEVLTEMTKEGAI